MSINSSPKDVCFNTHDVRKLDEYSMTFFAALDTHPEIFSQQYHIKQSQAKTSLSYYINYSECINKALLFLCYVTNTKLRQHEQHGELRENSTTTMLRNAMTDLAKLTLEFQSINSLDSTKVSAMDLIIDILRTCICWCEFCISIGVWLEQPTPSYDLYHMGTIVTTEPFTGQMIISTSTHQSSANAFMNRAKIRMQQTQMSRSSCVPALNALINRVGVTDDNRPRLVGLSHIHITLKNKHIPPLPIARLHDRNNSGSNVGQCEFIIPPFTAWKKPNGTSIATEFECEITETTVNLLKTACIMLMRVKEKKVDKGSAVMGSPVFTSSYVKGGRRGGVPTAPDVIDFGDVAGTTATNETLEENMQNIIELFGGSPRRAGAKKKTASAQKKTGKKSTKTLTDRVHTINGVEYKVWLGPRGGHYIRKNKKYVRISVA